MARPASDPRGRCSDAGGRTRHDRGPAIGMWGKTWHGPRVSAPLVAGAVYGGQSELPRTRAAAAAMVSGTSAKVRCPIPADSIAPMYARLSVWRTEGPALAESGGYPRDDPRADAVSQLSYVGSRTQQGDRARRGNLGIGCHERPELGELFGHPLQCASATGTTGERDSRRRHRISARTWSFDAK